MQATLEKHNINQIDFVFCPLCLAYIIPSLQANCVITLVYREGNDVDLQHMIQLQTHTTGHKKATQSKKEIKVEYVEILSVLIIIINAT